MIHLSPLAKSARFGVCRGCSTSGTLWGIVRGGEARSGGAAFPSLQVRGSGQKPMQQKPHEH